MKRQQINMPLLRRTAQQHYVYLVRTVVPNHGKLFGFHSSHPPSASWPRNRASPPHYRIGSAHARLPCPAGAESPRLCTLPSASGENLFSLRRLAEGRANCFSLMPVSYSRQPACAASVVDTTVLPCDQQRFALTLSVSIPFCLTAKRISRLVAMIRSV
jgi:hypothetical protein